MIESDALGGAKTTIGGHVDASLAVGEAQIDPGLLLANADICGIETVGCGGHGSSPRVCMDAGPVAAQALGNRQRGASRRVDALGPVVGTVGEMGAGSAHHVRPARARRGDTERTFAADSRAPVRGAVAGSVENTAAAGVTAERRDRLGDPAVKYAHGSATAALVAVAEAVLGPAAVVRRRPRMAGEDGAHDPKRVPAAFFCLGAAGPKWAHEPDGGIHHRVFFHRQEACLPDGVDILLRADRGRLEASA